MAKPEISRAHLRYVRWWALVRYARWLGVRWRGVPPHARDVLEERIARAIRA